LLSNFPKIILYVDKGVAAVLKYFLEIIAHNAKNCNSQTQRITFLGGIMSSIKGYIDYTKREYCHDIHCPIQVLLDKESEGSKAYELIRGICKSSCLHTTHEFHAWLIAHGYLVVRPEA
jgi:hypothetical protein